MKVKQSTNKHIFMQEGIDVVASVEDAEKDWPGWVSFGYIGGSQGLLVDNDEWKSFVDLVAEIDSYKRIKNEQK